MIKNIIANLNNNLLIVLEKTIKKLRRFQQKYTNKEESELPYSSLSPIDNGDENGHYSKALLWALKNRKREDIKNIALTGPYGSGKSSIIKTFQKVYDGNDLKFLNISLATFKEERSKFDAQGNKIQVDTSELLRCIETSILEQIFYHEEDKKIPDSRFKKIKSYGTKKLLLYSFGGLLFLIALSNYFYPYFIQSIFKDAPLSNSLCNFIHYSQILIIATGIFFIIYKSVRVVSTITINKLKIQNAEIGIGENSNKSILNHHIDEILYFFSVRPYNVVIIEDLDRFQETDIFTKLREVNLLLNNSEKTKSKEIVFVYAVRDDMFTDKERTKFFDFIIPVIPVINSSNSSEILLKKKKQFKYQLSDSLIEDISFFIDDMRLLHNITNEYYLYKEKLSSGLNQDKLFAIITYKNIYPNDFMQLSYNQGDLYSALNQKQNLIKNSLLEIDTEIEKYREEITNYENVFITNLKDLRLLYLFRIIISLPGFKSFVINNQEIAVDQVLEDKYFEYIKSNKFLFNQLFFDNYNRESTRQNEKVTTFSEIEKQVDPSKSYEEKVEEINDIKKGKINTLKNKIQELEQEKQQKRNGKIADLLRSGHLSISTLSENIDVNFLNLLLRNGYIAEDYLDYISLFHEESITRSDYQFHINVKNEINQPFDFKLTRIKKLIQKINIHDFQCEYILNYDLMDYLLSYPKKYSSQIDSIFNQLKNESKHSIEFILGYYQISQKQALFVKKLCNKWTNIWGYIESSPDFTEEMKFIYFKAIIDNGEIPDIVQISNQSSFKKFILSQPLFLNINDEKEKLKRLINELKLVFTNIDFENTSKEMLSYIYEMNAYELNTQMVYSIINEFGEFNQIEYDTSNYSAIRSSKAENLINYIDQKIDKYISSVYLPMSSNDHEKDEYLVLLLNSNMNFENKQLILSKTKTKLTHLSKIEDLGLYPFILEKSRIIASWENLLHDYNSQNIVDETTAREITEASINFINNTENAEELSKVKIPKEVNSKNIYGGFWKKIIQTDAISDEAYKLITKSSPWWYDDLDFENLSENKIKALLENNCINPNTNSFVALKEHSIGLNISLLEKRKVEYFKILDELNFDSEDLNMVLKSTILKNSEKLQILKVCSDETIVENDDNLKLIATIMSVDKTFIINDNLLETILLTGIVPIFDRLRLFIRHSNKYGSTFIESFLNSLGGDYAKITDTGLKAKVAMKDENLQLLNILVSKGYISSFSTLASNYRVNHKRK